VTELDEPDPYARQRTPSPEPLASDKLTALKGTDMSLYAVFKTLGLEVRLKPILNSMKYLYDNDGDLFPCEGKDGPGTVGRTDLITDENEDAKWTVHAFGEQLQHVHWITKPLWRSLALIHGNVSVREEESITQRLTSYQYFGNEVGGPGVAYSYTALLVNIPAAASRGVTSA
jgi:hypothetical protein